MNDRLHELGIAGHLDDDARRRLEGVDVDVVHSIGLAGAWTPALILRVADRGESAVANLVHEIGADGPWTPELLDELLDLDADRVLALVRERHWSVMGPHNLMGRLLGELRPED